VVESHFLVFKRAKILKKKKLPVIVMLITGKRYKIPFNSDVYREK